MTAETLLVSSQSHHLVQLGNAADNDCELAAFFCFPRCALQASDALEQQITLLDLVVPKGHIQPLFVGIGHDTAGVSAGAPPCFGHKGRQFRETDALVDLSHRPFMALLLLFLGDSLGGHGYLLGSDSELVKDYLQPAATLALALSIASLPFTIPMGVNAMQKIEIEGSNDSRTFPIYVKHLNSCAN